MAATDTPHIQEAVQAIYDIYEGHEGHEAHGIWHKIKHNVPTLQQKEVLPELTNTGPISFLPNVGQGQYFGKRSKAFSTP